MSLNTSDLPIAPLGFDEVITMPSEVEEKLQQITPQQAASMEYETVQEELRKSEERYRFLVEATSQIVWNTNAVGELFSEQPSWSKFTGQTQEEYRVWGWLNAIHPDDQDYTAKAWKDALANRSLYEVEHRLRRHDGDYRYMNVRAIPILENDGSIREWVGVDTDITERKQIQAARDLLKAAAQRSRALREAEAARSELQRVFMQAPAAISTFRGPNHVIETANPLYCRMVNNHDLVGKTIREVFSETQEQGFFELLDRVYSSGEAFVGKEMRVAFDRNGDGILEEGFWNFVYQPLLDAYGQVYGIMTHAVEVTQQVLARQEIEKKAEELANLTQALERSNRELDQFAYVTSHDLKAPLRAIANLSEWIEEDIAEQLTEESHQHLNLMRKRVHRMSALIDGILQYSRAGRVQQIETVNVSTLLSEVIELLAPPPSVLIVVPPQMPTLKTERIPLQQVLMNLISNAIKYTEPYNARIWVNVREVGKYYEFAIADNGIGIAPQYHQKIWGIFQRLEARDKVEGTGIGLSVVKKIVESRGGRVWIESELGVGATFYFTWPKQASVRIKS